MNAVKKKKKTTTGGNEWDKEEGWARASQYNKAVQ